MSTSSTYVKCAAVVFDWCMCSAMRLRMPRKGMRSSRRSVTTALGRERWSCRGRRWGRTWGRRRLWRRARSGEATHVLIGDAPAGTSPLNLRYVNAQLARELARRRGRQDTLSRRCRRRWRRRRGDSRSRSFGPNPLAPFPSPLTPLLPSPSEGRGGDGGEGGRTPLSVSGRGRGRGLLRFWLSLAKLLDNHQD
jgi:hypothetical protein